ncbi:uncharacterized protein LOC119179785 [Rhipicephalus microplus]|uniref:uncharacterized protein LOC119179785 n=1 Tax=Rhipicephalus microplus TaxID=6941 RepID=UPI003F6C9B7F
MATKTWLYAIVIGAAATTALRSLPNPMPSGDKFHKACKNVFDYFSTCDDAVWATETFKKNRRKYIPLVPRSVFPQAVADCLENSLSVFEWEIVCSDAMTLRKALKCYGRTMMKITPPDGMEVVRELVTVFEECMDGIINSSMTTTKTPMA